MMERQKVDKDMLEKQTRVLKDRMRFNELKKVAIKENFSRIDEDLSTIRARLIPVEQYQTSREELAAEKVDEILKVSLNYQVIEGQSLKQVESEPEIKPLNLHDILRRCKLNREILNQSVGGGARSKFERYRAERQQQKISSMSRYSSISQLPGSRSVTFSRNEIEGIPDTPVP